MPEPKLIGSVTFTRQQIRAVDRHHNRVSQAGTKINVITTDAKFGISIAVFGPSRQIMPPGR